MSDTLITVDNVSKKFCRSLKKSLWYGVKDMSSEFFGRSNSHNGLRESEFWANKDISFELKRGECLGLLGRNGAGKTTLLKMLNGLIKPDQGRIEIRGRIGGLIALGAGFNPILTGRENIYVNASVLGLTKQEIDEKIDEIIDFAEIGAFIDAPVQSYSSGMQVRLGFSIASALSPDVLLLDEVLAVGDIGFQAKCFTRIAEIKKNSAIIFVSHAMTSVARLSDRVMVLSDGKTQLVGGTQEGIHYYNMMASNKGSVKQISYEGNGEITIEDVKIDLIKKNDDENKLYRTSLSVQIKVKSNIPTTDIIIDFIFKNLDGTSAAECPSTLSSNKLKIENNARASINMTLDTVPLSTGTYLCSLYVLSPSCTTHYHAWLNFTELEVTNDNRFTSPIQIPASWSLE